MLLPLLPHHNKIHARINRLSAHYDLNTLMIAAPHTNNKMSAVETTKSKKMTDDSTCSLTSATSSMSSFFESRSVQFCGEVTVFVTIENELSRNEAKALWFRRRELAEIRDRVRRESHRLRRHDAAFQQAAKCMQLFLARRVPYVKVDVDECNEISVVEPTKIDDSASAPQQRKIERAARILVQGEARGLERTCLVQMISMNSAISGSRITRSVKHVQIHIAKVLKMQALLQYCSADVRATCLAAECCSNKSSAVVWALAMAQADEEEALRYDDNDEDSDDSNSCQTQQQRRNNSMVEKVAYALRYRPVSI